MEGGQINPDTLRRWGELPLPEDDGLAEALFHDGVASPFPVKEELNFKIALWQAASDVSRARTKPCMLLVSVFLRGWSSIACQREATCARQGRVIASAGHARRVIW